MLLSIENYAGKIGTFSDSDVKTNGPRVVQYSDYYTVIVFISSCMNV